MCSYCHLPLPLPRPLCRSFPARGPSPRTPKGVSSVARASAKHLTPRFHAGPKNFVQAVKGRWPERPLSVRVHGAPLAAIAPLRMSLSWLRAGDSAADHLAARFGSLPGCCRPLPGRCAPVACSAPSSSRFRYVQHIRRAFTTRPSAGSAGRAASGDRAAAAGAAAAEWAPVPDGRCCARYTQRQRFVAQLAPSRPSAAMSPRWERWPRRQRRQTRDQARI